MRRRIFLFLASWAGSVGVGLAQEPVNALSVDTSNMKVTIGLDRETYLPGEEATVTLEVSNPAAVPVTTLAPFLSATGCFIHRRAEEGVLPAGGWSDNCVAVPVDASNTTTFAPGETRKLALKSYDWTFDIGPLVFGPGGSVPLRAGEWEITYRYGTTLAAARYKVAAAQLEAEGIAALRDVTISHDQGSPAPYAVTPHVHVVALRSDGISYICVPQAHVRQGNPIASKEVMATRPNLNDPRLLTVLITPFKRVATSKDPVVSLSATADGNGNLTIDWTDSGGGQGSYFYLASYPRSH